MNTPDDPIDFGTLVQRCMNDPQFARAMMTLFAEQAPTMVRELEAGLLAGDAPRATKAAHTIKGSAGNIAAMRLSEIAARLEDDCRSGEIGRVRDRLKEVEDELSRCLAYIAARNSHRRRTARATPRILRRASL